MKKNSGFGEAVEIYLRKVVSRSPLPLPYLGIGLVFIVFGFSLKYLPNSVASVRNVSDVVTIAAKLGDYQVARSLWNESMPGLEDLVYPERKIEARIADLEQKLQIYPSNRDIYLALGKLYEQVGNVEKAKEYLERARVLSPND